MQQLLYAGEVRSIKDIEIPKTEVKDAELKLAQQLIEQQASETFDPSAYTDDVRGAHRGGGAEEGRGPGDHAGRGARSGGAQVIDLMEALRASLEKKAPRQAKAPRREPPPKRASRRSARSRPSAAPPRKAAKKIAAASRASMHQYGVRDVEKLLRLPRSTIRALIDAGFVSPGARAAQRAGASRSRT